MTRLLNPYAVLALAIVLPGAGHVAMGEPRRGLGFACFALLFFFLTWVTTTSDQDFIARHAGGLFVWALSIPDAYRRARIGYTLARRG